MGYVQSKARKSPIKSTNPSPCSDNENFEELNHQGTVNDQDHCRHPTKPYSTTPERQIPHPKTQLSQSARQGERELHSLDANNTQTNVGPQRDLGKRPKRTRVQLILLILTSSYLYQRHQTVDGEPRFREIPPIQNGMKCSSFFLTRRKRICYK